MAKEKKTVVKPQKKTQVAKTTKAPQKKTDGALHVVVTTGGEVYEGNVDSIAEFLLGLGIKNTNTKTVISASYNGRTVDRVLMVAKARLLFTQKLRAEVFEKHVRLALNAH